MASNVVASGNIERTGDRDVFVVDVTNGTLSVQLRPPTGEANWSNLAAAITIRNSVGGVVVSGGPGVPSGWTVNLAPSVATGRYTIEVAPVGWLTASTGFTTYGSLGAYELAINAPQGIAPLAPGTSAFSPITPTRLIDTRNGIGAPARVGGGRQVVVQVADGVVVPGRERRSGQCRRCQSVRSRVRHGLSLLGKRSRHVHAQLRGRPDRGEHDHRRAVVGGAVVRVDVLGDRHPRRHHRLAEPKRNVTIDADRAETSHRHPIGHRWRAARRWADLGGRLQRGRARWVERGRRQRHRRERRGAGIPHRLPCSDARPNTSTVNFVGNEARPNNTIVGLSAGRICIFSDAATDVLVDLLGSFGAGGLAYLPTPPVRVLDTRRSGTLGPGVAVAYSVSAAGLGGQVPGAAYVNVTAANHVAPGYVTTYDCVTRRDTSTLNQQVGQATANGAIVPLSALQSCGWTYGGGDLIVDLNGWWVP